MNNEDIEKNELLDLKRLQLISYMICGFNFEAAKDSVDKGSENIEDLIMGNFEVTLSQMKKIIDSLCEFSERFHDDEGVEYGGFTDDETGMMLYLREVKKVIH